MARTGSSFGVGEGRMNRTLLFVALSGCLALAAARDARAVIISTGDGSGNTTAPPGLAGWANVGQVNGSSGVYLGNGYVATAAHVGKGSINLPGVGTFTPTADPAVPITTPGGGSNADLIVFKLSSNPALASLSLGDTPADGDPLVMVGFGRNRATGLTMWDVNGSTWTETTNPALADASGYKWLGTTSKRWGTNVARDFAGSPTDDIGTTGGRVTTSFATNFSLAGTPFEAQAAANDSGGAVFNAAGELVGIMFAIGTFNGQPEAAVFGNLTYAANLTTYEQQIYTVTGIPEPASLGAIAMVGMLLARRRR